MELTWEDRGDIITTIGYAADGVIRGLEHYLSDPQDGHVVIHKGVKWTSFSVEGYYEELQVAFKKLLKYKVIVPSGPQLTELLEEKAKAAYPGDWGEVDYDTPWYSINARENWKLPAPRRFK